MQCRECPLANLFPLAAHEEYDEGRRVGREGKGREDADHAGRAEQAPSILAPQLAKGQAPPYPIASPFRVSAALPKLPLLARLAHFLLPSLSTRPTPRAISRLSLSSTNCNHICHTHSQA